LHGFLTDSTHFRKSALHHKTADYHIRQTPTMTILYNNMSSEITFSTFEIISIALQLLTLIIVVTQLINTHKGDCRGAVVTTTQNPDGYCVTRQAKLSMHEVPHDIVHELQHLE